MSLWPETTFQIATSSTVTVQQFRHEYRRSLPS